MRILVALFLLLASCGAAAAQGCGSQNPNCIVPTAPPGTNNSQAASTAFVLQNVPLAPGRVISTVTPVTISPSDCGTMISAGTGSTGFFAFTLPSPSSFPTNPNCSFGIYNADSARGKQLVGFPFPATGILWPNQSIALGIVGGAWAVINPPPPFIPGAAITLYIDPINGNDNNDCLAPTTGACATATKAGKYYSRQWIVNQTVTIQFAAGTYNNLTNLDFWDIPPFIGSGIVQIVGDAGTPSNVHIQMTTTANAAFSFAYVAGNFSIHGFKIDSSVGSGNGNGLYQEGRLSKVTYGNINFGAFAGGFMVSGIYGGHFETDSNNTISGGAAAYIICQDNSICHDTGGVTTLTGTPAFSTALLVAHGGGAIVGIGSSTFSGAATGTSCQADDFALVDVVSVAALPGSGTCALSNGGQAGSVTAQTTFLSNGIAFASLPTPIAGMFAYISDGKSSNCGDSSCTTWGTTVTAGSGALKLFIWFNGTNWTLIGK